MSPGIGMNRKTLVRILPVAAALVAAILPALPAHASQSAAAKLNEGVQIPVGRHVNALHPMGVAHAPDARTVATSSTNTFCATGTAECLNLRNCNFSAGVMQIWTIETAAGFNCAYVFFVSYVGNVNPQAVWPFSCGSGLNNAYAGHHVFQVTAYDTNTGFLYAPVSSGGGNPVNLGLTSGGNYAGPAGLWVQEDNNGGSVNSRLIDSLTTCRDNHILQRVYRGCSTDGCLIRESNNPSSGYAWDWDTITHNP